MKAHDRCLLGLCEFVYEQSSTEAGVCQVQHLKAVDEERKDSDITAFYPVKRHPGGHGRP